MLCLPLQKHSLNLTQIQHKPFVSILQYLWYAMDIWYARYSLIFSPKNLFQDRFQCIFFVEAKLEILFRMMEEKILIVHITRWLDESSLDFQRHLSCTLILWPQISTYHWKSFQSRLSGIYLADANVRQEIS